MKFAICIQIFVIVSCTNLASLSTALPEIYNEDMTALEQGYAKIKANVLTSNQNDEDIQNGFKALDEVCKAIRKRSYQPETDMLGFANDQGQASAIKKCCEVIRMYLEEKEKVHKILCVQSPDMHPCCAKAERELKKQRLAYKALCKSPPLPPITEATPTEESTTTRETRTRTTKSSTTTARPTTTKPPIINPKPSTPSPTPVCKEKIDLLYIVDGSGSVGQANFNLVKRFLQTLSNRFTIAQDEVRVGIQQYSSVNRYKYHTQLNNSQKNGDKGKLKATIDSMQYLKGRTYTGQALERASNIMFTLRNGDRPRVPNALILLTDGATADKSVQFSVADKFKKAGGKIIAVAIGNKKTINTYIKDLERTASRGTDGKKLVFQAPFKELDTIEDALTQELCQNVHAG